MSREGLISVIIPVYKVEAYLEKCINSVMAQTYTNLEIILVDDGSPDRCGDICDNFAEMDSRISVIHQENGGISAARNSALRIANGEYIAFVDSDDYIDSNMYQVLYEKARGTGSDVVECDLRHTFPNRESVEVGKRYADKEHLLGLGRGVVWNKLYSMELLRKANILFPVGLYYEDVEFFVKLIPHIEHYDYVCIAPYHYVQHPDSINNFSSARAVEIFQVLKNITAYYHEHGFFSEYKEALEFLYSRILLCSSLMRLCKMKDAAFRRVAVAENWKLLVDTFPDWKRNPILKEQKTRQALFMRTVEPVTYRCYSSIFQLVFAAKRGFNR
ncbi:glycosyl transferase [Clostridia bacterium]|nr:glycosyl transferase [Clostridia bacterium]